MHAHEILHAVAVRDKGIIRIRFCIPLTRKFRACRAIHRCILLLHSTPCNRTRLISGTSPHPGQYRPDAYCKVRSSTRIVKTADPLSNPSCTHLRLIQICFSVFILPSLFQKVMTLSACISEHQAWLAGRRRLEYTMAITKNRKRAMSKLLNPPVLYIRCCVEACMPDSVCMPAEDYSSVILPFLSARITPHIQTVFTAFGISFHCLR